MKVTDKLKQVGMSMASDVATRLSGKSGEQPNTEDYVDLELTEAIVKDWSAVSKHGAKEIIEKYGLPDEATPSRLIWYNNGPWKRTIVYRDEIPHEFPVPHTDAIEQFIDYRVPPEMFSAIAEFDGSIVAERTNGEVSARCHMEAANFIALNLMHDIVTGKINVQQARDQYAEIASAYTLNRTAPYAEGFQFELPTGNTRDSDKATIGGAMAHQMAEKMKDMIGKDEN
ncbi:hypothetical protein ACTHQ2_22335, partial [Bacillus subtilis]|uniref:hypothetical protein n=1 Tax=Bacillus subtilis TaxID=1423 RepID=UPI003F7C5E96